jgi:uncharacterized repeat protein (TIGR01451 family)
MFAGVRRAVAVAAVAIVLVGTLSGTAALAVTIPSNDVTVDGWQNTNATWGNTLNGANSKYATGQSVPIRVYGSFAAGSTQTVILKYDFQEAPSGPVHFFDWLGSLTNTLSPNPCTGIAGCSAFTSVAIPHDATAPTPAAGQIPGHLRAYGVTAINFSSGYTYDSGDGTKSISITFTVAGASGATNVVFAYSAHLGTENSYGPGHGAGDFPGGSGKSYAAVTGLSFANMGLNPNTAIVSQSDLSVSKTDAPDPVLAGTELTYTVVVSNSVGPNLAQGVVVTDVVPAQLTVVRTSWVKTAPAGSGTCTGTTTISCAVGDLNAGSGQATATIVGLVGAAVPGGTVITNTAGAKPTTPVDNDLSNNYATAATTVNVPAPTADLSVVKSGPATATAGDPSGYDYTLTVTNNGPSTVFGGFSVSDTLPAGVSFGSGTGCVAAGQLVTCSSADFLGMGDQKVFTVHVTLDSTVPAGSVVTNTAVVTSDGTPDPTPTNDRSTITTTVAASADLSVVKTGPATATAGDPSGYDYTLTVTNNGPSSQIGGFSVSDTLAAGVSFGSGTGCSATGQLVTCSSPDPLTVSAQKVFTVHVTLDSTVPAGSVVTNTAVVTSGGTPDPTPTNDRSTITTTVAASADLSVVKTGPATATAGDPSGYDYTLTVTNNGPSSQTGGFSVSDTLPSGVSFGSGAGCIAAGQLVTCSSPDPLPVSGQKVFTVHVTLDGAVPGGSVVTNTVVVSSGGTPDPTPTNDRSTVTTTVGGSADLSISKRAPATAVAGAPGGFDYSITVTNTGPSTSSAGFSVSDTLPAGVSFASGPGCSAVGQLVTCTSNAPLGVGSHVTFTVHVTVASSVADGAILTNTAVVTSLGTGDPNSGNNSAQAVTTVNRVSDLDVTKVPVGQFVAGAEATYTITVTNLGPSDRSGPLTVTDTLPPEQTFVRAAGNGWTCAVTGNIVVCTTPAGVTASSSSAFTFVVLLSPSSPGITVNTVTTGPHTQIVPTPVVRKADLSITKTHTGVFQAPGSGSYTVTVTNHGPSDTSATITVADTLPAGFSLTSASGAGFSCSSGPGSSVTCLRDTPLAAGQSVVITLNVSVTPAAAGNSINNVSVQSSEDPDVNNNNAVDPTAVNHPPVAVNDSVTTPLNVPVTVSVLVNDHDPDGDALAVTGHGTAANGTVSCSASACTYTPASGFQGTDSFSYTISDGRGGTATATVTVTVTGPDVALGLSHSGNLSVTTPQPAAPVLYLAEGNTLAGWQEFITILNPVDTPATAVVTYSCEEPAGVKVSCGIPNDTVQRTVPPLSRTTISVGDPAAGGVNGTFTGVGAEITSKVPLVVERPMYMNQPAGAFSQIPVLVSGATDSRAVPPADKWYFAEGTTQPGYQTYLTILNPSDQPTSATIVYSVEGLASPVVRTRLLPPRSRTTIDVASTEEGGLGMQAVGLATVVSAPTPIVVERPIYFDHDLGGGVGVVNGATDKPGSIHPVTTPDYLFFAEGNGLPDFEEFITVLNTSATAGTVTVDYLVEGTSVPVVEQCAIGASARLTIDVSRDGSTCALGRGRSGTSDARGVSAKVSADMPIVAERPMYFNRIFPEIGAVNGGHLVAGVAIPEETSSEYYFAEGSTRFGFDQFWTLANPNDTTVRVAITYYFDGHPAQTATYDVGPSTRRTIQVFNPADAGVGRDGDNGLDFGVRVVTVNPATGNPDNMVFGIERPFYTRRAIGGMSTDDGHDLSAITREAIFGAETPTGPLHATVTNVGGAGTTGPLTVTDTLPAGIRYASATGAGWTCAAAGQLVTCTNPGPLAPGQATSFDLFVTISQSAVGTVVNSAVVSTPDDRNQSNDSASDQATVVPPS